MAVRLKRTCMRSFKVTMFKLKVKYLAARKSNKESEGGILMDGDNTTQANENDTKASILHAKCDGESCKEQEPAFVEKIWNDVLADVEVNSNLGGDTNAIVFGHNESQSDEHLSNGECLDDDSIFKANTLVEICSSSDQSNTDIQDIEVEPQQANTNNPNEVHKNPANIDLSVDQCMIDSTFLDKSESEDNPYKKAKTVNNVSVDLISASTHKMNGISGSLMGNNNDTAYNENNADTGTNNSDVSHLETCNENETNITGSIIAQCVDCAIVADVDVLIDTPANMAGCMEDEAGDKSKASQILNDFMGNTLQNLSFLGLSIENLGEKMKVFGNNLIASYNQRISSLNEAKRGAEDKANQVVLQKSREFDELQCLTKNLCGSILNQQYNLISNAIASLPLSSISSTLGSLSLSLDLYIDRNLHMINERDSIIQDKKREVDNMTGEMEILKTKTRMLEESGDYLHKQNGRLKESNSLYSVAINVISAICSNLKKSTEDLSAFQNEFYSSFTSLHAMLTEQSSFLRYELSKISEKLNFLNESLSKLNVSKIKDYTLDCIGEIQNQYSAEIGHLTSINRELIDQVSALRSDISELQAKNDALLLTNNEIKEEVELKESYSKELEKSTDELMKSNKFYEDQLITSDNIIKSLKESKMRTSLEFSAEIEKIRKVYLKENGLLKLRVEELENELFLRSKHSAKDD